jgi:2-polyprenyl-3-methyl-5-hydroxy-6-metoxy-1,4-benzoquinol methylase
MNTIELYQDKDKQYFSSARKDWIDSLPRSDTARLLEIGCGNGDTGYYALEQQKCVSATGIEINDFAAKSAEEKITEVICGNVETLSLPFQEGSFDLLVMSEVLEHLVDPWRVLKKVKPFMKPGALVFASSPNVSNYKIILMQLSGNWELTSEGVMDRTHLRWFTPNSYRAMFERCDYTVDSVGPVSEFRIKKKIISKMTFGIFDHLLIVQINLKGHC